MFLFIGSETCKIYGQHVHQDILGRMNNSKGCLRVNQTLKSHIPKNPNKFLIIPKCENSHMFWNPDSQASHSWECECQEEC